MTARARGPERARVSLARALSKLGHGSRAEAERLVQEGRVKVGGRLVLDPSLRLDPDRAAIVVDGKRVRRAEPVYLALHKPTGYVTTRSDPDRRPTVFDLLPPGTPYVSAVGRLDLDSSGLLLLTNDNRWAEGIAAPEAHVEKVYRVRLDAPLDALSASILETGVLIGGSTTRPCQLRPVGHDRRSIEVTLVEGRNRQVRRMMAVVGRKVEDLQRVRIGVVELGELAPGGWRALRRDEVLGLSRR